MFEIVKMILAWRGRGQPTDSEDSIGRLPEIMQRKGIIRAGELAVNRTKFTASPITTLRTREKLGVSPLGFMNYRQLAKTYDGLDKEPGRDTIEGHELEALEAFSRSSGVVSIGYVKVDPDDIFIDRGILFPNAIVVSVQMPADKMKLAPSYETLKMILGTYVKTGVAVNKVAALLRRWGFGAQAGAGLGGFTTYPVLAQKAGMGSFIRSGLLLTPESGPCHRLAVVYTNIKNLPTGRDNPCDWVSEYCDQCGTCIERCPPKAIRTNPVRINVKHLQYIRDDRCMAHFAKCYGCSICIKVCPFFVRGYHALREKWDKRVGQSPYQIEEPLLSPGLPEATEKHPTR